MAEIIREQTEDEKKDFVDISGRTIDLDKILRLMLQRKGKEVAIKNRDKKFEERIPLPISSIMVDISRLVKMAELEKVGYLGSKSLPLDALEKVKLKIIKKLDLDLYLDPKKFELIEEFQEVDDMATKKEGQTIAVLGRKYLFKDTNYTYSVMETTEEAVKRIKKVK